jgi:hypothetical protein
VSSPVGYGGLGPDLGIFQTRCQAGTTVFLVQADDGMSADVRALFPGYVEAEAARLGCGPLKLKLPRAMVAVSAARQLEPETSATKRSTASVRRATCIRMRTHCLASALKATSNFST